MVSTGPWRCSRKQSRRYGSGLLKPNSTHDAVVTFTQPDSRAEKEAAPHPPPVWSACAWPGRKRPNGFVALSV